MHRLLKTLLPLAVLLLTAFPSEAQTKAKSDPFSVVGYVKNEAGEPMQHILVELKESLSFTTTDAEGFFAIRIPRPGSELNIAAQGYLPVNVVVKDKSQINVTLMKEPFIKDRDIAVLYGKQKKSHMTGAVSTVYGTDIEDIPVIFQNTAISGKLVGVHTIQESGAPASANADLYLRGRRSWNNRNPLVYVDGHLRDFSTVSAFELEEISAYKDAAALSIFGLQGGNGAIMATTKRGIESRPILSFNAQVGFESPTEMPDFLDSYHYAVLYNEALVNDGGKPRYTEDDLALYQSGESPLTHPDVDWLDEFIKNFSVSQKYNLNLRGGNSVTKYFVSLSYVNNNGLYKTDKSVNSYNTNANFQTYSIRSNVDVNLTKTLTLSLDLYGRQRIQRNPGSGTGTSSLFNVLLSLPSNKFPVNYGPDKVAGINEFRANPYGVLNHSGYTQYIHSTMEASLKAGQKLDFILKGLSVYGALAFDARFDNTIDRSKSYQVYQYDGVDEETGEILFKTWGENTAQKNSNSFGSSRIRIFDVQAGLDYAHNFGRHGLTGLLFVNRNEYSTDTQRLTNIHQGFGGRFAYDFAEKYLLETSFSYMGTEQLPPNHRYGFFPSVSAGYVLSNENFIKDNIPNIINFLKFRASYGLVGNDDGLPYFYYLPSFKLNNSNRYNFGTTGTGVPSWVESGLYNEFVTYEKSKKFNVGVDMKILKHINLTADYFNERNTQILVERSSISTVLGFGPSGNPKSNSGITTNRGFEIDLSVDGGKRDFYYQVGIQFTNVHNEIVFNDEQIFEYSYRRAPGNSINDPTGYVANGLYRDEQDMLNSPLTAFGNTYPGDIKYRDLNGDGVVDNNDISYIGKNNFPELYGAAYLQINWKGFDLGATLSFVGERTYNAYNISTIAFYNVAGTGGQYDGNVQQFHWDNRYVPTDPSTWDTATYPRLSLAGRNHNAQSSTFWLENGAFVRLKDVEFGYTLPLRITQKWHISKLRFFYSGFNLLTWHKMRMTAPEIGPNGNGYPVQRTHSLGVNIQF
ncbi:MAG: SusC/RagA family TonB-linked outer membrane protein [Candidatus Cryptobacteroides sp.]